MKFHNAFTLLILVILMSGCTEEIKDPSAFFAIEIKDAKKSFKESDVLQLSIKSKKGREVATASFSIEGVDATKVSEKTATATLEGKRLGRHYVKANVTSDGETYSVNREIIITSSITPKVYAYTILDSYPHDISAYTQGLEFANDTLYESTGQRKESTLRKVDMTTGTTLKIVPLADQYFGEGLTILNNKIYQLTWQAGTGFIYDLASLEKKGTFVYGDSKEGWGLCNDGSKIYKSDGTEKIWTLNAETLAEERYIEMYTNTAKIKSVNELEWVDGKIYANIYQKDAIAIVNPANGAVEGVLDLTDLKSKVTQHPKLDVLNGIAYNGEPGILYVTGKNWDRLFKIKVLID